MALTDLLPTRLRKGTLGKAGRDWTQVTTLQYEMNRLFDDFFEEVGLKPFRELSAELPTFSPNIEVLETGDMLKVIAELPGLDENDISVKVEEDDLIIKGEKRHEERTEGEYFRRREVSYGAFRRVIPLTCKVDPEKAEASFQKGILRITLPKIAEVESEHGKKIEITAA